MMMTYPASPRRWFVLLMMTLALVLVARPSCGKAVMTTTTTSSSTRTVWKGTATTIQEQQQQQQQDDRQLQSGFGSGNAGSGGSGSSTTTVPTQTPIAAPPPTSQPVVLTTMMPTSSSSSTGGGSVGSSGGNSGSGSSSGNSNGNSDWVPLTFSYDYRTFVNYGQTAGQGSNNISSTQDGVKLVQDSVGGALSQLLVDQNVSGVIDQMTSDELGDCDTGNWTLTDYNGCVNAITNITASLDPSLDPVIVEQSALQFIQLFVPQFNAQYNGSIQVIFDYPYNIKAGVLITMFGVGMDMDATATQVLETAFADTFRPVLLANQNPRMTLTGATVTLQTSLNAAAGGRNRNRYLQSATTDSSPPYDKAEMSVQVVCTGGDVCTTETLTTLLTETAGPPLSEPLRQAVREQGRQGGLTYFDSVNRLVIGSVVLAAAVNETDPIDGPGVQKDKNSKWLWIIIGGNVLLIIAGCIVAFVRVRRRTARVHAREDGKSGQDDHLNNDDAYHSSLQHRDQQQQKLQYIDDLEEHDVRTQDQSYVLEDGSRGTGTSPQRMGDQKQSAWLRGSNVGHYDDAHSPPQSGHLSLRSSSGGGSYQDPYNDKTRI